MATSSSSDGFRKRTTLVFEKISEIMNIIMKEKIKWYITGQFIWDKILDIVHCVKRKKPLWPDAVWCGEKFCRYCGGKKNLKNRT